MEKEYCRDRTFPTKHLKNLPQIYSFRNGLRTFVVDNATTDQLDICKKTISEAGIRGDNVGIDEYAEDGANIELLFNYSEIFQATDPVSGRIMAFMFIQPCLYQRSYDSCTASVYVFRSGDVDDVVYAELMNLTAEFAKAIDVGYTQCFTQVALCFPSLLLELRRQGFLTVAMIPDSVEVAGIGVRESAIMVKQFGLPDRPIKSNEDVQRVLQSTFTPGRVAEKYTNISLPQVPNLPRIVVLSSGRQLVFRNVRKEEDETMYNLFVDAMINGDGYSVYEIPSLDVFRVMVLSKSFTVAIEEESTKQLIGLMSFQDSVMSRRSHVRICEESVIIKKEFRKQRLGSVTRSAAKLIARSLGYESEHMNTLITNHAAINILRRFNFPIIGVLPRAAYQMEVGWVDMVIANFDYGKEDTAILKNVDKVAQQVTNINKTVSKL